VWRGRGRKEETETRGGSLLILEHAHELRRLLPKFRSKIEAGHQLLHRGNKLPAAARLDSILEAPADVEPDHVLDALAQHQNLLQVLRDDIALYHPR